ncbi:MAG: Fur family transcriptional regulator [Candidatus Nanopelagicales bacterium]
MSIPQRQTKQRTAIAEILAEVDDFRSAQQLHDDLRHRGVSVGLTTVYRCLQSLTAAGEIDFLVNDEGETVYRKCSGEHHHHLVCRSCGATVEIAGPTVERWADSVAAEHGYSQVSHTMELFGLCPSCS